MLKSDRPLKRLVVLPLACLLTFGRILSAAQTETRTAEPATAEPATEAASTQASEDDASSLAWYQASNERVFTPIPGYVALGTGGVFLLTSIITGSVALKLNSDLEDDCPDSVCYEPQHDKADRLEALAAVTDVFLPLSAVLLISGAALMMLNKQTEEKYGTRTETASKKKAPRLSFTTSSVVWRF